MKSQDLAAYALPDAPGVYSFFQGEVLLYIGRATSLKDRVRSYFSHDLIETRGRRIVDMVALADRLTWQQTTSVLEAIFLEAALIKEKQPTYNVDDKDNKSFLWVVLTDEAFPAVRTVRGRELALHEQGVKKLSFPIKKAFGPFQSGATIREALRLVRRMFPYRDERCVPCEESGIKKPCFNRQINLCPGMCVGAITQEAYAKTVRRLSLLLGGKVSELKAGIEKDMKRAAQEEQFEQAAELKKTLYAIEHISDISLLKHGGALVDVSGGALNVPTIEQVEAYDVAHTAGTSSRGVMVVVRDGIPDKKSYRTFTIHTAKGGDDIAALREVLSRRLAHEEWSLPQLVVVDGSSAHKRAAEYELARVGLSSVPVVAVTKDARHRPKMIVGKQRELIMRYEKDILLANHEAHRFSLKKHEAARSKSFLIKKTKR